MSKNFNSNPEFLIVLIDTRRPGLLKLTRRETYLSPHLILLLLSRSRSSEVQIACDTTSRSREFGDNNYFNSEGWAEF